jgi:Methylamine utilisation protein MauE/AhpC/TSA family
MIVLLARLLLAAVFAIAGVAKLGRRAGTESTLAAFAVPDRLHRPLAVALPVAELAIAAALLPSATAPWAGVAALLLLAAFTVAIGRALARGDEVDCNCFGSLRGSRITGWTLARNLVLLIPAGIVAGAGWSDPGASAVGWIGDLGGDPALIALAGVALVVALASFAFAAQLMGQNGRLLARLDRLERLAGIAGTTAGVGMPLPEFTLPDLDGRPVASAKLLDGDRDLLLFFTDPSCHACYPLLPEIGRRQREPGAGPRPVVVSIGERGAIRAKAAEHGLGPVLVHETLELPKSLGVTGVPGAILIDRGGLVAGEPAVGAQAVGRLLAAVEASPLELITVEAGR